MDSNSFLSQVIFGNTVTQYIIASLILITILVISKLVIRNVLGRLRALAEKTETTIDDFIIAVLEKIFLPFLYLSALYISARTLTLHPQASKAINIFEMTVIVYSAGRFAMAAMDYGFGVYCAKRQLDKGFERSLHGLLKVTKIFVWAIIAVFYLDNMGFKISTIIAGLGIGGIAVALAAQALLKDFFSYFSIVLDRPFKVGDFIVVGDCTGTVEHVGIKTTRIRSLSGEQIILSNTDLTDSRVHNYEAMERRRVLFRLGVAYETSTQQLKDIPQVIGGIIKRVPGTHFDRAHFFSYGDFSLDCEIVYYVNGADYNKYMDIQQSINLAIKEEFEKRNIKFAYPTQTLYINK